MMERHRLSSKTAIVVLTLSLLLAGILEIALGPLMLTPPEVIRGSWAAWHGSHDPAAVVIGAVRWPRLLVAVLVGAGLASTGVTLQAVFRNPMADPAVIGVSSGGALGAVLVIRFGVTGWGPWVTPLTSFAAGLLAVVVIYRLSTVRGNTAVHSFILAGIAVGSLCSAIVALILSLAPLDMIPQALFWLMGGLEGSTWQHVTLLSVFCLAGLVVYLFMSRALDVLSLGEEQAEGVGVNGQWVKQVALFTSAVVVGACVSVTGIIAFVGLIVPHFMRMLVGPRHSVLLVASALGGAALLAVSDLVARVAFLPFQMHVGIVTSCLGAPFFLYLLRRYYKSA